jgi:diadenylate cyclase
MFDGSTTEFFNLFKEYFFIFLDIALVAYLFYRIYLIISKTRAAQLGIGILIILLIAILAQLTKLEAVTWLVQNLTAYIVITIIVLMAPELRRLLSQIGQGRLMSFVLPKSTLPISEIVEAVRVLTKTKTGALIVIARQTGMNNYIEKGIHIEGIISVELLRTIFSYKSPLHDGAVIIDRGLIEAAACYLPLSESKQIKRTYGARHRAGLGISEESDAIVIICSEETGKVSLCIDSKLIPAVKVSILKPILVEMMTPQPNYLKLLEEGVSEDLVRKLGWDEVELKT